MVVIAEASTVFYKDLTICELSEVRCKETNISRLDRFLAADFRFNRR